MNKNCSGFLFIALAASFAHGGTIIPSPNDLEFCFAEDLWIDGASDPVSGSLTGYFFGEDIDNNHIIDDMELSFFEATWIPTGSSPVPFTVWETNDFPFGPLPGTFAYHLLNDTLDFSVTNFDDLTFEVSSSGGSRILDSTSTPVLSSSTILQAENCAAVPDSGSSLALLLAGLTGMAIVKRAVGKKNLAGE